MPPMAGRRRNDWRTPACNNSHGPSPTPADQLRNDVMNPLQCQMITSLGGKQKLATDPVPRLDNKRRERIVLSCGCPQFTVFRYFQYILTEQIQRRPP